MKDLKTIKALVKLILEQDPKARNSDSYLYFRVIHYVAKMKIGASPIIRSILIKQRYIPCKIG